MNQVKTHGVDRARFRDALRKGMSIDAAFGYAEAWEAQAAGKGHPLDRRLVKNCVKESLKEGGMPHEVLSRAMKRRISMKGAGATTGDDDDGGMMDMGDTTADDMTNVNNELDLGATTVKDELFKVASDPDQTRRFQMGDRASRKKWVRDAMSAATAAVLPKQTLTPPPAPAAPAGPAPSAAPKPNQGPAAPKAPKAPVGAQTAKTPPATNLIAKGIHAIGQAAEFASGQRENAKRMAGDAAKRQPDGTFRPGDMTPANDTADGVRAFVDRLRMRRKARDEGLPGGVMPRGKVLQGMAMAGDLLPDKTEWKPTPDPAHDDPAGMYNNPAASAASRKAGTDNPSGKPMHIIG